MKISNKEHSTVFGCFIGLFILRIFIPWFAGTLMQRHSAIDYIAALFIMVLFTVIVIVLYIRWAGSDAFRLKGIICKTTIIIFKK